MTEVLPAQIQTDGQPFYTSPGLRRSRLSQPSLYIPQQPSLPSRTRTPDTSRDNSGTLSRKHRSVSSPSRLNDISQFEDFSSSPSSLSSTENDDSSTISDSGPEILFSNYTILPFKIDEEGNEAPPSSPQNVSTSPDLTGTIRNVLSARNHILIKAEDDTAVKQEPSRHVDYLSHEWKEEDIWSSWRHIVSQRTLYGEKSRLENASWRTWAKQKNKLRTVNPRNLNWLKDCDVTWLYGPLQTASSYSISQQTSETASHLSKSNSFLNKKPILKKRSVSEIMLQKSLSNSSLVRQAAAAVQAQQRSPYETLSRRPSDSITDTLSSRGTSREGTDYFSSESTSGFQSPTPELGERKHIRFDNKVEQCIAVELKDGDFDDDEPVHDNNDGSSEDGIIMMRRPRRRKTKPRFRRSSTSDSKIIAKLPSTTLKDRLESPNLDSQSHSLGSNPTWRPRLSPSPSLETLRPHNPDKNFLVEDEDDDDDDLADGQLHWPLGNVHNENLKGHMNRLDEVEPGQLEDERLGGMRRTESGMFMPVDEGDDPAMGGIVGRVLDSVNTARDIAHVIWNVGWRR